MGRLEDILKSVEENKVANPPVRRNVYVADLDMTVNTDLETPDEINYATKTQVLEKPKQEYMGLKECENPFKTVFDTSVSGLERVLDTVAPESVRVPFKGVSKGSVIAGASSAYLTWGFLKIVGKDIAMSGELEKSALKGETSLKEYTAKSIESLSNREKGNVEERTEFAKELQKNNVAFNQWVQDCKFTPNSKAEKFFYDLGGSITSIGMSVLAFAFTKNPMLAISFISLPEFTSTYLQAIEKGKDADTAMKAGATNYAFISATEYLGGRILWSTLSKSGFINNAIKKITNLNPRWIIPFASGGEEGVQESSQTVGSEAINRYYDISQITGREVIKDALYNGLQAFLGAFLFGAVASNLQFSKIFEKEKTELLKLKDAKGKQLYTPEQADKIAKNTANFVQSKELQNEILNISRNERDNSLSKEARNPQKMKQIIEENLKKMETALPEIKKELMDIKDKVKENFSELGLDKEQLDMVAELTQARATLYYNAFGITPLQFYYLNELEITVDENSNILSNGKETGYTVKFNEKKVAEAIDSGKIENIIKSIRTKENLNNFGNYVNKLVTEGKMTEEQRSIVYSQLAERMEELPTTEQVVDRVREEEVDKLTNGNKETIIESRGENGETYQPTNEFRELQEQSKRISNEVSWGERSKLLNDDLRKRIIVSLSNELQSRSNLRRDNFRFDIKVESPYGQKFNLSKNIDGQTFREMFEIARTFTTNGELVDLHSVEDYNNFTNYLSDDGLSGFSITPEGDLVSVFNARDVSGKRGFLYAIADIVKREAKTLDCYNSKNQPLAQMYSQVFGFKPVAYMDYNMEYDHDNIAMNHNNPQVYFMANTTENVPLKKFDDWDEAKAYQMKSADVFNQPAWHGSPRDFDIFDLTFSLTGEGAMAHGWGLYFAKNRETGEGYKIKLEQNYFEKRLLERVKLAKQEAERAIKNKKISDIDSWRKLYKNHRPIIEEYHIPYQFTKEQVVDALNKEIKKLENKIKEKGGRLFKVEIPEDDVLLDEDKPFEEQPKKVQEALLKMRERYDFSGVNRVLNKIKKLSNKEIDEDKFRKLFYAFVNVDENPDSWTNYMNFLQEKLNPKDATSIFSLSTREDVQNFNGLKDFSGLTGKQIYREITNFFGSDKDASLLLNKYGIKGITYEGYRDGRCYVIFDDKAIKILEKFYQMGGPNARTALLDKLEIAQELEYNNVTPENIWKQTGWMHDVDGKWKFEINDKKAKLKPKNLNKSVTKLGDILDHEDLFDAYPELKDMTVYIQKLRKDTYGYFDGRDIYMSKRYTEKDKLDEFLSGLLHEIQHYIQRAEGFARGGNKKMFRDKRVPKRLRDTQYKRDILEWSLYGEVEGLKKGKQGMNQTAQSYIREHIKDLKKLKNKEINKRIKEWEEYNKQLADYDKNTRFAKYQRLKGETEARNTQTRQDMTPEERRLSLPYETQDYPNEDLIIRLQDGTEVPYTPRQDNFTGKNLPMVRGELLPRPIDTPIVEQTKSIIRVFRGGDRSTIIHEMAHIFLRDIEVIENQGGVQDEQFRKIKATLDNWLGKKEGQKYTVEQQEKFAQGFETYMATGQAPKPELKSVFDYFKNWMSQIYNGIKNMIPITPEVKTMFDEILTLQPTNNAIQTQTEGGNGGGGNIVNTPQTQEGGDIVPVTPDAKDLGKVEKKKNTSIIDFTNKFIQPVTTRLGAIDVRLEYEMKMFEARLAMRQAKYKNASLDFLKETDDLQKKNKQDYLNFDRALKNRDINTINRITEKYPKLKTAYEKVRTMLDDIKADLMIYGVGGLENYFPRKIANIDGLISYLEGTENWSEIERAMKQSDPNYKSWSEEKKAEFVASYLQGYRAGVKTSSAHTKQRKIDTINDEMDRYYENSNNALLEYINSISNFIETAKMLKLGKDKVFEMGGITKDGIIDMKQVVNNIESVLGTYVKDLVNNKTITREQEREIAQILKARFNFQNTNNLVSVIKSIGYLTTLGNINSVITQFGDLTYSINNAGVFGTLKAIFGDKKIKMQDIGIDHPAEDFADGIGFTQKLLNAVLTSIGFKYVDSLGKNTYIATTFMKYKNMIEKNEKKAFDDISRRYGEEFAKDLIDDIKNNRLSENIYLFAHSELSRVQPISLSEVPTEYLTHPVGRVFYSLKTFWIKQFNRVITDNKRLIQEGIKEKNADKVKEGATSMARLIVLFVILGAGTDMLKDLIYLRKIDLEDTILDNFLKILGISRYTMYKGREEGYGRVLLDTIFTVPVVQMLDSFLTELGRAGKGKMKLKDLRIASNIPIIGNPYYWWLGGGRTKEKKKNKRRAL